MCHRDQLNRMSMHRSLIRRILTQQIIMHTQMRRQFRSRCNCLIGYDNIAGTVIQDTNNRTIFHRPASQITHAFISPFTIEITPFQIWQCNANRFYFTYRFHPANFIVNKFRDINSDITTVTFSPSFLPQVSGNFSHLINFPGKCRTVF